MVKILMPPLRLIDFDKQKYYENEPKFKGIYSRNNLSKIKDGAFIINLDEYESIGTHCIALYVNDKNNTCFDSFGGELIAKKMRKFIENKNIYRIQACDSIICGYFCIEFIDSML